MVRYSIYQDVIFKNIYRYDAVNKYCTKRYDKKILVDSNRWDGGKAGKRDEKTHDRNSSWNGKGNTLRVSHR